MRRQQVVVLFGLLRPLLDAFGEKVKTLPLPCVFRCPRVAKTLPLPCVFRCPRLADPVPVALVWLIQCLLPCGPSGHAAGRAFRQPGKTLPFCLLAFAMCFTACLPCFPLPLPCLLFTAAFALFFPLPSFG